MSKKVICPVCWHEETFRAIRQEQEADHDDPVLAYWCKPYGGARGQQVTVWDGGYWECGICRLRLPAFSMALLIDAVLRVSDPNSDSYDEKEKTFKDAIEAAGGESK